uniref:Uncharacterized protein n=1 Tax=Ditylenchus dipsaci TaxID=166011 RepID=A0A915D8Q2_9BILA
MVLISLLFAICLWNGVRSTPSVLISSPFDNFRIECPHYSGAQRLSIRMIESQGMIRQDSVFALSCNHIDELYPWQTLLQETQLNFTCAAREYVAGIARLSDTRIQVECCRMRTRSESQCIEQRFAKPVGTDVRFCDLGQRPIEAIRADFPSTTPVPLTRLPLKQIITSTVRLHYQRRHLMSLQKNPEPREPKKIIKISRIPSLMQPEKETISVPAVTEANSIKPAIKEPTSIAATSPTTTAQTALIQPETLREQVAVMIKQDQLKEVIVNKQLGPEKTELRHHSPSSIEVLAADKAHEKSFPSEKDYENVDEARVELMESLAGMMQARKDAKKIITRVKAAGLPQNKQTSVTSEEFAERMLKEIEGNGDPNKAGELLKQSMEVLADLGRVGEQNDPEEEMHNKRGSPGHEKGDWLVTHRHCGKLNGQGLA